MAIDFDGTGDFLTNASTPVSTHPLTMGCWFNSDVANATDTIFGLTDADDTDRYLLVLAGAVAGDPLRCTCVAGGNTTNTDTSTGFTVGTWHYACLQVGSATDRRVTIDGGSEGTSVVSRDTTGLTNIAIGAGNAGGGGTYDGKSADACIWNIKLTNAQVSLLAKGVSPLTIEPQAIVAYWPLVRDPYNDWVGGFNLTINGNPTVSAHPPKVGWQPWRIGGAKKIAAAGGSRGIFRSPIFGSGVFGKRIAA